MSNPTTLQDVHVLILGLGASGLAMARWCARCGARVTVADTREAPPQLVALRTAVPDATFVAGPFTAALIDGTSVRAVFRSPGLLPAEVAPVLDAARAIGLWTGGELTLFAQALAELRDARRYEPRVLAITGTNGKTTVTSLLGQLVARAGRRVAVAGNIGPTLLDTLTQALDAQAAADEQARLDAEQAAADEATAESAKDTLAEIDRALEDSARLNAEVAQDDASGDDEGPAVEIAAPPPAVPELTAMPQVWVLELSSFQLDGVDNFEPTAATVLNLSQDHLDWHGSLDAYAQAKSRIFGQRALMVLNREDARVMAMLPEPVKVKLQKPQVRAHVTFGADMPRRPGDFGIEVLNGMAWLVRAQEADETRKKRRGEAEEELFIQRLMPADALRIRGRHNAVNALAALALAMAADCPLAPMLYGLREYQGEPHRVEPVAVVDEVEFFDDSKGTNVGATVAALKSLGAERRLVVILGGVGKGQDFSPLAEPVALYARAAVLIGRDAPLIEAALAATGVALVHAASMAEAVQLAAARAHAGDAVLMSPACASFDMFENYGHRAQVFVEAVQALADDGLPLSAHATEEHL
ncbi:MAG: UDP-N-acetylmuramoylalanine--D-glutamate ligase [Paracidovorax wautersii]|uniref:UDP-N-acetylmuramoylalanine--D-glutamate ligase n=1 Tax=Paracidovorax wautersii TaxID=1177982 RepID=A0A7V8JRE5_9BURK|nr:MAG: UDP-N-acetylmuramoylalanine--D-glutamate ligase [Paracidovorax wautersii]